MLVKICGMKQPDNIRQVANLLPDMMGFIFYPKSSRYIGDPAPDMIRGLPAQIRRVGVFVDEEYERLLTLTIRYGIDAVQLHGSESPRFCAKLREKGLLVIKALGIAGSDDFRRTSDYEEVCDLLLFDTLSKSFGGTGLSFDWKLLECYRGKIPFVLSGGIGPDGLQAIKEIAHSHFAGIDLNSRFEISPGHKDLVLLSHFLHSLKEY